MGVRFVSESSSYAFEVTRRPPDEDGADRHPYRVVAWSRGAPTTDAPLDEHRFDVEAMNTVANYLPSTDPRSARASERTGRIVAELSVSLIGSTVSFMFCRRNPGTDPQRHGDFRWVGLLPETPLEDVVVHLQSGGSPFDGDDWDWQEDWYYPYEQYRAEPVQR